MFMKRLVAVTLTGLLFATQPVLAEETAVQPEQAGSAGGVATESVSPAPLEETTPAPAQETTAPATETPAPAGGMEMGGPGMMGEPGMSMGEQAGAGKTGGMAMEPGTQGPGKEGCRMGKGGRKGMMHGGMGKGCMGKGCMGHSGMTQEQYGELIGRLKMLEARTAKIEVMLERLLEQ